MRPAYLFIMLLATVVLSACGGGKKVLKGGGKTLSFNQRSQFDVYYFDASKQKILGNYQESARLYAEALKIDPTSHAVMYQLANLNMAVSNYHDAVYWAEKSMLANPEFNYWYAGQLAQGYNKIGDFSRSAEVFNIMIEQEPDRRRNYEEASRQYINAGQFKKSIAILETYVDKFGIDEDAARMLEGLNFEISKPKEAIGWMVKLVEAYPDDTRYKGLLAESYSRDQQWQKAKDIYFAILASEPNNGYANFGLSEIYQKTNQADSSFHYLITAFDDKRVPLEMKMKVIGSYFPHLQTNAKMREQAIQLTQRLVQVHEKEEQAYIANGDVLHASGMLAEARESILKATELNPGDIGIWRKLLSVDDELEDFSFLKQDAARALEMFPSQPFLYIINSYACYATRDYKGAMRIASEGLDIALLTNDKVDLLSTVGDAAYELGEFEKCFSTYDELLELSPNNDGALNNYSYYLSEQGVRLNEALDMIRKALALNPNRPTYIDTHGWILFGLGEYNDALPELEKAYKLLPGDKEIADHYVQCLIKLDRVTEADKIKKEMTEH